MTGEIVKSIDLENGLKLAIYDESKKIAADRWVVKFAARMEIPVNCISQEGANGVNPDEIKSGLGDIVLFEHKRERNFIDEKEKNETFDSLCTMFLETSLNYLSHADFPVKFILKKYSEYQKKKNRYL